MKVVAINGSPRRNGNTAGALKIACEELEKEGIETEIIQIGGKRFSGCVNCGQCGKNQNRRCGIENDDMNSVIEKLYEADGIIIGSPVYFSNVTTEVKALIDRAGFVSMVNGNPLRRKVGAAVVAAGRVGSNVAYSAINYLFGMSEMVTAHSKHWNMTLSYNVGDLEKDVQGMETFKDVGQNMAWLLKKIN